MSNVIEMDRIIQQQAQVIKRLRVELEDLRRSRARFSLAHFTKLEKDRNDEITRLRARVAELEELLAESRAEADECVCQGNSHGHDEALCDRINAVLPPEEQG
jgi:hypothetical protein